jgi:O-antigen/teichoic acid export membrane protein
MIRQLVGHTAAYTFANLLSRGTVLVWLIVLPGFMSAADYGALGLIMTTAALVNLVPLEVSQGMARYFPGAPDGEKRGWAATAWTFTLLTLSVAGLIALAASPWLNRRLLGEGSHLPVFRIALLYFALNTSFLFVQNLFRWAFRPRDYTIVTAVFALVTLTLSVGLAAVLPNSLAGVLIGLVTGAAVGVALGLLRLRGILGLRIEPSKLQRMLRFSLPLVPASVALFLSTYASRFILNDLLTLTDVGLFTWASQLAGIPALMLLGVQGAVTPLVMKHHAEPGTPVVLARSFETILAGALWLCVAMGLLTPELIRLLGYSAYEGAAPLVAILGPALLLLQVYVFAPGFAVAERTEWQLFVSILGAAAAVVFNYLFVNAMGLMGAAIATLASSAIFIGSWFILSNRLYPVPVRWLRLALFAVAAALCDLIAPRLGGGLVEAIGIKAFLLAILAACAAVLGFVHLGQFKTLLTWRRDGGDDSYKRMA